MDVFMWYILFAVTTSLAAMYELFIPVMRSLASKFPNNNVVEYKYVTYFTFFSLSVLSAPILLPSCIIPSVGERFRQVLLKSLS